MALLVLDVPRFHKVEKETCATRIVGRIQGPKSSASPPQNANTYVKVHVTWCYLYRAIDRDDNLVDSCLSEKRKMEAAKRFFSQAVATVGHSPKRG